jgi:glyceraldehyde-3-phosphate dehydrogenase (ferredoxin)
MVYELFSENSGACRFHRKWVEAIVDDIIRAHYDIDVDYEAHQFALAEQIYQYQGDDSTFWESERVVDIIHQYLERWGEIGLDDPELDRWIARFRADKWSAARAYWNEIAVGIREAFAAGAEAVPRQLSPHQAAALADGD